MSDPLGLISGAGGAGRLAATPMGGVPADPQGPSFGDVLKKNLEEVNRLQEDATRAVEDLTLNRRTDLEGVLSAQAKADTAFKMLQAVRNQVMRAYEELQQMRV